MALDLQGHTTRKRQHDQMYGGTFSAYDCKHVQYMFLNNKQLNNKQLEGGHVGNLVEGRLRCVNVSQFYVIYGIFKRRIRYISLLGNFDRVNIGIFL